MRPYAGPVPLSTPVAAAPALRRPAGALVALLVAALGWIAAAAPAGAATPAEDAAAEQHPVVLVGATGLRWDDLGSLTTPALWELSRSASLGSTVVRSKWSYTCPSAGWLAVSAGGRADDVNRRVH